MKAISKPWANGEKSVEVDFAGQRPTSSCPKGRPMPEFSANADFGGPAHDLSGIRVLNVTGASPGKPQAASLPPLRRVVRTTSVSQRSQA